MTLISDGIDLRTTLAWTQDLAAEAAARAVALKAAGMNAREKPDGSLVTDVDQGVERFLRDAITERFPGHAIYGEEFGGAGQTSEAAPLWAIDPIDGTTNLAHGLPHWAVCVGLVVRGIPAIGVVALPEMNQTFIAAHGLGAALNGKPLKPLPAGGALSQEDAYCVCTTSVQMMEFSRLPARLRLYGSAAMDCCWTAAGLLSGSQSIGVSLYDIAASICVANETGAETRWLRTGEPFSADGLAATGSIGDDALITAPPATLTYLRGVLSMKGDVK